MVYVPSTNYNCYYVRDSNTIRAYEFNPSHNQTISYRDYYINSHYLYVDGEQTFSNYSTLPTCLSSSEITDNVFYRNDLDNILVITFILLIICFWFPYKIISRLFGRWLKI